MAINRTLAPDEAKDLNNRFKFHPADDGAVEMHAEMRKIIHGAAVAALAMTQPAASREQARMVACLEEAMFWGNAAIARVNEDGWRK